MPRGITENEVWKACDALLLEGNRPTIERVRQKIGRGSPNTVSPFLESWFKHLGGRIKDPGAFAAPPELPDPIQQAAKHFWEVASAEARQDLDERLRAGLADAVANVESEKERAAIAAAAAFEAAAKAARLQAELDQRDAALDQEKAGRATAESQLVDGRAQVDQLRTRLDHALAETAQVRETAQRDLGEAIDRFTAAERRAALEIDKERTARGKAERHVEVLGNRLEELSRDTRSALQEQLDSITQLRAHVSHLESEASDASVREAAFGARIEELTASLVLAQRDAHTARAEAALAERVVATLQSPATTAKRPRAPAPRGARAKSTP